MKNIILMTTTALALATTTMSEEGIPWGNDNGCFESVPYSCCSQMLFFMEDSYCGPNYCAGILILGPYPTWASALVNAPVHQSGFRWYTKYVNGAGCQYKELLGCTESQQCYYGDIPLIRMECDYYDVLEGPCSGS